MIPLESLKLDNRKDIIASKNTSNPEEILIKRKINQDMNLQEKERKFHEIYHS